MSLEQEAAAVAQVAYPNSDLVLLRNGAGEPMAALTSGAHVMSRTPYAHGYQAGHAAALAKIDRAAVEKCIEQALDGDCGPGVPAFLADQIIDLLRGPSRG